MLKSLIKLRVNYSLLDQDGVFLKVLRNQTEFAEKLVWRDAVKILPNIFQFFVLIADDPKSIIRRNEIITLFQS